MANLPHNTSAPLWNNIARQRRELIDKNGASPSSKTETSICELEDQLLNTSATDLDGVILKLEILFEQYLHEHNEEAYQHLGVIGDLRRLTFQ